MTKKSFSVITADWDQDKQALRGVREQVFINEQGVDKSLEWDDLDAHCLHLLAQDHNARPIGTARMSATGHIGRMAVLKDWRGQRVGSALLVHLIDIAGTQGLQEVRLHAQTAAEGFYEKHGFIAEGEVFMDANIPHRVMRRALP